MTGDGSQGNPYVVMDAADLNSLRTLIVTSGTYPYVELGADIDMSVYSVFTPLPASYCNFNGKGNRIYNLNILTGSGNSGLFSQLTTQECKDVYIDGSVVGSSPATYGGIGIFAGVLHLISSNGVISGIHCSGYLEGTLYSNSALGGVCGVLQCDSPSGTNNAMQNCSFHGTIKAMSTSAVTSINNTVPYLGGITGELLTKNGYGALSISKCITNLTAILDTTTANMGFGGVVGYFNSGGSLSLPAVDRCVAQMEVRILTAAASARTLLIGGIAAYSHQSVMPGPAQINRCAAHIKLHYDPPSTIAGIYFAGIYAYKVDSPVSISQSYSVMSIANPNTKPLPAAFTVDGIQTYGTRSIMASFYDAEVLAASFSGTVVDASNGITTANMKSQTFLEAQGWVF